MENSVDVVDAVIFAKNDAPKRVPSIECLNSEMPGRLHHKDRGRRAFKTLLNRLRLRKSASADITEPDPTYKVAYLGNVVTGWAKGDGCVEKPLATLWRNYTQSSRPDVRMQLTVSGGGLKATTKDHGLTEYWANRLTFCAAPPHFPRLFCWVYRHEGRRLRHELRCHAVLCSSSQIARQIEAKLKNSLALALTEFKRDKISRQNARLSLVNSVYENPTIPRRKILLSTGSQNYRPPMERSKSAPKLTIIEEHLEETEEIFEGRTRDPKKIYRHDSAGAILDKKNQLRTKLEASKTIDEDCDIDFQRKRESRVKFCDDIPEDTALDDRSEMILQELVEESFRNDLIESCNLNGWLRSLTDTPDLIPLDCDDGSLSSGCESASTVTSDLDQPLFTAILEADEETSLLEDVTNALQRNMDNEEIKEKKRSELDFKVGGSVLSSVRNVDRLHDMKKYCCIKSSLSTNILHSDEVSLVPIGECQTDFSSLKVFKKKVQIELDRDVKYDDEGEVDNFEEEENGSACSDESGYDELIDCASSVSNIVLV